MLSWAHQRCVSVPGVEQHWVSGDPSGVPQAKIPKGPGLTWLYVQFFFLHLLHWKRSVTVPPVLAIWCSRMASWVMASRSFFSSSLAISCHQHWPGWVSVAMALLPSKYHSPTPYPSSPKTGLILLSVLAGGLRPIRMKKPPHPQTKTAASRDLSLCRGNWAPDL